MLVRLASRVVVLDPTSATLAATTAEAGARGGNSTAAATVASAATAAATARTHLVAVIRVFALVPVLSEASATVPAVGRSLAAGILEAIALGAGLRTVVRPERIAGSAMTAAPDVGATAGTVARSNLAAWASLARGAVVFVTVLATVSAGVLVAVLAIVAAGMRLRHVGLLALGAALFRD